MSNVPVCLALSNVGYIGTFFMFLTWNCNLSLHFKKQYLVFQGLECLSSPGKGCSELLSFGLRIIRRPVDAGYFSLLGHPGGWGSLAVIALEGPGASFSETSKPAHSRALACKGGHWTLCCNSAWLQMGSYFGSSLCAVDLNRDGLSDLLVGAPMFSEVRDEGQVTVYINRGNVSIHLIHWLWQWGYAGMGREGYVSSQYWLSTLFWMPRGPLYPEELKWLNSC